MVRIRPLVIDVRGSSSEHVALFQAPDTQVERLVFTGSASGGPIFYPMKEPTALFVRETFK